MSSSSALTTYKRQEGILSVSQDRKSLTWVATNSQDGRPSVVIAVPTITNIQQTPPTNPKVMLKIFSQPAGQSEALSQTFNFTSPSNARTEATTITATLTLAIQAVKAAENSIDGTKGGSSAAMTMATAIASGSAKGRNFWDDDERLKNDDKLQQSLFKANPALQKTFLESLRTKPESLSTSQFSSQFWSTRIHLLRAHAIERSQTQGSYNVLSAVKVNNVMNLSHEQVALVFAQHPLVRRVYDKEVPKALNESDFWSRFFQSRLVKKLRGEKIDPSDPIDKILDKYLDEDEFLGRSRAYDAAVPRIIDVEGNEENHSQRKGNAPDSSLRPRSLDKVPIIRTLNSLSEKIMAQVAPSDVDPSQPIGMDETTYNNLRLKDLQDGREESRIVLKVRDQSQFFSDSQTSKSAEDVFAEPRKDPGKTIAAVSDNFTKNFPNPGAGVLEANGDATDTGETEGIDNEENNNPARSATYHVFELIKQHRIQTEPIPTASGLSSTIYSRVILTHSTTTEFLHQFWGAFLSGRPERVDEIRSLVESLNRALDRIEAVAQDAETERENDIKLAQKMANEKFKKTGRKSRVDMAGVSGGAAIVKQLLEPTINALAKATANYKKALIEQSNDDG